MVSGLVVNIDKTQIINIGVNREDVEYASDLKLEIAMQFKLLGIKFSNSAVFADQNFFDLNKILQFSIDYW